MNVLLIFDRYSILFERINSENNIPVHTYQLTNPNYAVFRGEQSFDTFCELHLQNALRPVEL